MRDKEYIIDVDHVTIRFNKSRQGVDNLKEYVIHMIKRELLFQEFLAVKDVSLKVKQGEAWGLIGTNGSGKSTLLKIMAGQLEPSGGEVICDAIPYYIPQHLGQYNHLTVAGALRVEEKIDAYRKETYVRKQQFHN